MNSAATFCIKLNQQAFAKDHNNKSNNKTEAEAGRFGQSCSRINKLSSRDNKSVTINLTKARMHL